MYSFFHSTTRWHGLDLRLSEGSCNVVLVASKGLADKGFKMNECQDCAVAITADNTQDEGGKFASPEGEFALCDDCANARIDAYLEN